MRTYQQFINGKLVSPTGFAVIEVENPSTGEIMAQTPNGGKEDGLAALAAAHKAQNAWAALPAVAAGSCTVRQPCG